MLKRFIHILKPDFFFLFCMTSLQNLSLICFLSTPSHVFSAATITPEKQFIFLNIDKKTKTASVQTMPHPSDFKNSQVLKSFKISLGKAKGDKQREGDNKTPEGLYFSRTHIPTKKLLTSKYGPRAVPLNFPNPVDQMLGKTGHGIWLHGAGNDTRMQEIFVTEGCVAFYNDDILKVSKYLAPHQTLVSISDNSQQLNHADTLDALYQRTHQWLTAWRARDTKTYFSYYHPEFKGRGKKLEEYKIYKRRIFSSYKKISLDIKDMRILSHQKYAMSIMNQDFHGDRHFTSQGRKVLYWLKTDGVWQIIRESFNNRRFQPLSLDSVDLE